MNLLPWLLALGLLVALLVWHCYLRRRRRQPAEGAEALAEGGAEAGLLERFAAMSLEAEAGGFSSSDGPTPEQATALRLLREVVEQSVQQGKPLSVVLREAETRRRRRLT